MKGSYKIEKTANLKKNPNNPRIIKDVKYKALMRSVKDFPKMLKYRPLLVDESNVILGGNQRLEAVKDAGLEDVYIIQVSEITEAEKQELILKDNIHYGRFDWNEIELEYEKQELLEYGFTQEEIDIVEDGWPGPPNHENKDHADVRIMIGEFFFLVPRDEWDEFDIELKRDVGLIYEEITKELRKRLGFDGISTN